MSRALVLALVILTSACEGNPATEPDVPAAPPAPAPAESEAGEGLSLRVPPAQIHRARREATGLARMPEGLRASTLARRRAEAGPTYAELARDAEAYAHRAIHAEGRVSLARAAGSRLWILALHTRREADRDLDPLYVLSVIDPRALEGEDARVDGWVVGPRTIGRHTLPLIVAYHVEPGGEDRRDARP